MGNRLSAHQVAQIFFNVGEAVNATSDHHTIIATTLQTIIQELGYKAASVRVLDPERQTLEIVATAGLSEAYLGKGPVEVERSPIDNAVLAGEPVVIEDIRQDPRWQYPDAAESEGLRSVLAVPLSITGRYVGVLRVYTAEVYAFTPEEQLLVAATGHLVARLIRNIRLQHALQTIAAEVNSSLAVREVLDALLTQVITQMNCKAGNIRLLGPKRKQLHLVATHGLSSEYLNKGEVLVEASPIDGQVVQGEVVMLFDIEHEPGFQYPDAARREGIRSVLAVPLAVRDRVIGVLRVYSAQPHRFNRDEVEFLRIVANLGAVAIDNARLYETLNEKYEAAREDWSGWYRFLTLS